MKNEILAYCNIKSRRLFHYLGLNKPTASGPNRQCQTE